MGDVTGRRWAFNGTLFLVGIFLICAGASNNIYTYGAMFSMVGFASGGNVPVASVVYLEFVPASGYYLLTMLSAWWAVGAVIDALVAWAFIGNFSCDLSLSDVCARADNMGWRYTLFTLGALVIFLASVRFFLFRFPESPYYLMAGGREAEAVEVIQYIAQKSKRPCTLTVEMLQEVNDRFGRDSQLTPIRPPFKELFLAQFKTLSLKKLKPLFGKPKLALQTGLIVWIWAAIGIAYPLYSSFLPVYLAAKFQSISFDYSTSATYRQYCYIAACTVPGPILAAFAIETRMGRRYTMAVGTLASGMFLYLSTLASTNIAVVAWNCTATLVINFMFAIQVR
jgi:MFS family permease